MAERDISARLRKAIKENNLFLVKRLLNRTTDIRNVDPAAPRYTSLAWAAVLGHEEIFDFLLSKGHDDEELSKDAENNTILILLAGLRSGVNSPYNISRVDSFQEAALRMARSYYDRFPFILDWSNVQGKTALHMASLHGNEDFATMLCDFHADIDLADLLGNTPLHYASSWGHISIIKLLIEHGCQFAARNNEGYTATDYAYSNTTKEKLEDSGRAAHDARRNARRPPYTQMKAQSLEGDEDWPLPSSHPHSILSPIANRVLANDAGAIAEYMKRNRSGSQGETSHHTIVESSLSHVVRAGGSKGSIDDAIAQRYTLRRLRPSMSAAALNQPSTPPSIGPRFRAGTNPSNTRPSLPFTMQSPAELEDSQDRNKRGGKLPSLQEPRDELPENHPPPIPPPKDSNSFHHRNPSLS